MVVGKRRNVRPAERAEILVAWQASGLSVVDFARERGLDKRSLYRWRGQERRTPVRRAVSLVEVPAPKTTGPWAAEVMTTHGPVRLATGASPSWVGQLIRELRRC